MRRLFILALLFVLSALPSPARALLPASSFAYDASAPLDVRAAHSWQEGTTQFQDVTFAAGAGRRIHAQIVLPASSVSRPGVLFVHWLGDPKTTNLTEFLPDARALAKRGVASVLVDAMWAAPDWFDKGRSPDTDLADSIRQVVDLRRALDLLAAQPNVDPHAIAYVGHDFGAMYGAVLSGLDPRPQYYVFMAGTTSFSDWFLLGAQPKDKAAFVTQMAGIDPTGFLAQSGARHFLFQFALHDQYVKVSDAQRFAAAAPGECGAFYYDADHGLAGAQILSDRLTWLESRLFATSDTYSVTKP